MDAAFLSMMPHNIGHEPAIGRDAWGNLTFGAQVLYRGRIQNKRRKVINREGNEVISETTLYLDTVNRILLDDRITLPSGYLPANPDIISAYRVDDENGPYFTQLYV
jgi:hypothetical protein